VPLIESIVILVALFSLMPWFFGFRPLWYQLWLALVLAAMVWVTVRRLSRTRQAAEEAKRKRDEAARRGRPPWLK
jgi:membrane protein implicated in regulation of membrane protease activity